MWETKRKLHCENESRKLEQNLYQKTPNITPINLLIHDHQGKPVLLIHNHQGKFVRDNKPVGTYFTVMMRQKAENEIRAAEEVDASYGAVNMCRRLQARLLRNMTNRVAIKHVATK
jgi:hypothetical protein